MKDLLKLRHEIEQELKFPSREMNVYEQQCYDNALLFVLGKVYAKTKFTKSLTYETVPSKGKLKSIEAVGSNKDKS